MKITKKDSVDLQHLLLFWNEDTDVNGHAIPTYRLEEIRRKIAEITDYDILDEYGDAWDVEKPEYEELGN